MEWRNIVGISIRDETTLRAIFKSRRFIENQHSDP